MPEETAVATKTVGDIFATVQPETRKVLQELFAELHPGLANVSGDIAAIFSAQSAGEFLSQLVDLQELFSPEDSYDATVSKLQDRIGQAEAVREAVLATIFEKIRPIERSYQNLYLYFQNAQMPGTTRAVELHILNGDASVMKDDKSETLLSMCKFLVERNDQFNFRRAICNVVVPGFVEQSVQQMLEEHAEKWGALLISDLNDHKSVKEVNVQFREKGSYEFLKRNETQASAHVVLVGWLRMRERHSFESLDGDDGLYVPPSLIFAGAIARTDEVTGMRQGPIGTRFGQIAGADKCRIEPRISQMEDLSMNKQVVPIIRDANNRLCFYGCRTLAEDPYGVYKFFTSYRIIRYIERQAAQVLRDVAGMTLDRNTVDEYVEKPLKAFLKEMTDDETLRTFDLSIDRSSANLSQGICDISLSVLPNGPAETFVLRLDVPKPGAKKN